MDAVGYAVKTPGTSSFMTPETFAFIDELTAQAKGLGLEVLVEVHSYYRRQIEIAQQVDWVYDFGLPPLVLYALHFGDAAPLVRWLGLRPVNCVTVLDTHDGIGVIDVGADATEAGSLADREGLLTPEQLDGLVEAMHDASGGASRQATGAAASNLDLYQVNCTFFDALGRDDDRYLLARLIQFMAPGVPQVYYVGLLAGGNDLELLARTGVGRDVNRHHYSAGEVAAALQEPVVRRLCEVIRLRNTHPAFGGEFSFGAGPASDGAQRGAALPAALGGGLDDGLADRLGGGLDDALADRLAERLADGAGRLWMRWERGDDWVLLDAQTRDPQTGSARFRLTWTSSEGLRAATHAEKPSSE